MKVGKWATLGFRCLSAVLTLSIFVLPGCKSFQGPDRSTMTLGFAEAAFGLGTEAKGELTTLRSKSLLRWDISEPLLLKIKGEPKGTDLYNQIVTELTNLFSLASISVTTDADLAKNLMVVEISDERILQTKDLTVPCYADYRYVKDGYLRTVDIFITRHTFEGNSCLIHEGMHALGFNGHPHRLDSVLSYTENTKELTDIDRLLIHALYDNEIQNNMPVGEVLTTIYSGWSKVPEQDGKRYIPGNISLELTADESPLVLNPEFLTNGRKKYLYKSLSNGSSTTTISYKKRDGNKERFGYLAYTKLSANYVFRKETYLEKIVSQSESHLGKMSVQEKSRVRHPLGGFNYLLTNSESHSCIFTVKYLKTHRRRGGHQVIGGYHCGESNQPLAVRDAESFIGSIQVIDKDPVIIRKHNKALLRLEKQGFAAMRISGNWPIDKSSVSGLKIVFKGDASGKLKLRVNNEICDGMLTKIGTNGLGQWTMKCHDNEDATGRFSWDSDGTMSFRGKTVESGMELEWTASHIL